MRNIKLSGAVASVLCLFLTACVTTPAPVRTGKLPVQEEAAQNEAETELETETELGLPTQDMLPSAAPPQGTFVPDLALNVCPIRVRNAPPSQPDGRITDYGQLFVIDNVIALATVPVNGACLSSGFGVRDGRLHKGIDLSAPRGTWVFSAAPGIVREAGWHGAFGYYILIEHGYNVFTRYAHLEAFVEGLEIGSEIGFGWPIAQVGNSSTQNIGVHLHYEVLTGNYQTPKKAFGLNAHDPFGFPVYVPQPSS